MCILMQKVIWMKLFFVKPHAKYFDQFYCGCGIGLYVNLGGYSYTLSSKWCLNMRKLDRFLVNKGTSNVFSYVTG